MRIIGLEPLSMNALRLVTIYI